MKKRSHKTKILTILLILCLVICLVPDHVFASDGDTEIGEIDFNMPSDELWSYKDAPFANLNEGCNYTIESQKWYSEDETITPSGANLKPTKGKKYTFSITLKAKDGYVFSSSDGEFYGVYRIHGINCDENDIQTALTSDGKELTFTMLPLTEAKDPADNPGVIVNTTVNEYMAEAPMQGQIKVIKDVGETINITGDTLGVSATLWFKPDSDGKSLVRTETKDEAVMSITFTAGQGYAGIDFLGNIDKNTSYSLNLNQTVYLGSKLTYTGSRMDTDTGRTILDERRDEYYVKLQFESTVRLMTKSTDDISKADIISAKFNYKVGESPVSSAMAVFMEGETQYEIAYEYWEELDGDGYPVAYWYSDPSKNSMVPAGRLITQFETGKTYVWSIQLKAKSGYEFTNNCSAVINGNTIAAQNVVKSSNTLYVSCAKIIKPIEPKEIETVEINDVTLAFNDGDKPVFTGTLPDGAPYKMIFEAWQTDGEGISSEGWFNNEDHLDLWGGKLITTFDKEKTYTYRLALGISAEGSENGWGFGSNTKLKINGKEVAFQRSSSDDREQFMVVTDLTMVPQEVSTPPEYKITEGANDTWTQNADGTLKFVANGDFAKFTGVKVDGKLIEADKYDTVSGSTVITLKKDYLTTLSVGKHTLTVVYNDGQCGAEFEIMPASSSGGGNVSTGPTANPSSQPGGSTAGTGTTGTGTAGTTGTAGSTGSDTKVADPTAEPASQTADVDTSDAKTTDDSDDSDTKDKKAAKTTKSTGSETESDSDTSPETGDNTNPVLWMAVLVLSGGILAGTAATNRKKKNSMK